MRHAGEILYGRQPVRETLRAHRRQLNGLFIKESAKPTPDLDEIHRLAQKAGITVRRVDDRGLDSMTEGGHHQGVAISVGPYPYVDFDELVMSIPEEGNPPLFLLLDHVQDPQNLGSILRSGEAAGVFGVAIPADRAAAVSPAAVRASAGAAEHLRVATVTNLVRTIKILKEKEFWIAGLEDAPTSKLYTEQDLTGRLGLVVGSEGEGLGRLVLENCDFVIRLPLRGKVGSLNAGVACAIAIYEVLRQRHGGKA